MEYGERNKEEWRLRSARQGQQTSEPSATLRDQFAMAALTGLLSSTNTPPNVNMHEAALSAYLVADALLAAREAK